MDIIIFWKKKNVNATLIRILLEYYCVHCEVNFVLSQYDVCHLCLPLGISQWSRRRRIARVSILFIINNGKPKNTGRRDELQKKKKFFPTIWLSRYSIKISNCEISHCWFICYTIGQRWRHAPPSRRNFCTCPPLIKCKKELIIFSKQDHSMMVKFSTQTSNFLKFFLQCVVMHVFRYSICVGVSASVILSKFYSAKHFGRPKKKKKK